MAIINDNNQNRPNRQGSGRFTNIQSYLGANRGAGQNLAQGVTNQVNKELDKNKQQANDSAASARAGIQAAQGTLNQGQQQLGQLKTIGQNIQQNTGAQNLDNQNSLGVKEFKNDPNFNQFQQIQSGQAINENALGIQSQNAANQAASLNQQAQNRANQAQTEQGRFDLLKQTFGGNVNPQYTQGQQRLDQLFLQKQGLGNLKNNLQQNVNTAKDLKNISQILGQDVSRVAGSEQGLMSSINQQATQNESDYLKMLESFIPEINKRRDTEFSDFENRLKNTGIKQSMGRVGPVVRTDAQGNPLPDQVSGKAVATPQGLTRDDLSYFGINSPTQVFNVFDNLKATDIVDKGRQAAGFADAANQRNVDEYAALADIMGLDAPNRKITQAADLGKAFVGKQGDASLKSRIESAARSFDKNARETNFNEHIGGKGWVQSSANAADLLRGAGIAQAREGRSFLGNLDTQANKIQSDFMNFLNQQGYGNVLGADGGQIQTVLPTTVGQKNVFGGTGDFTFKRGGFASTNPGDTFTNRLNQFENNDAARILASRQEGAIRDLDADDAVREALRSAGIKI
jgi:hypothetical protein